MLYDRAEIEVQAGAGGDGSASFRREAHVPRGGPDGGDGGRGGDVVLLCNDSLRDLHRFKGRTHLKAGRGGHGEGALRHGARGEDLVLVVPPGTEVVGVDGDLDGRRFDLVAHGQRASVARGGSGGHGNKRFATPTRQAPRFAERGLAGEQGRLSLQLKLLADVGLVGLPNAGKSSLISRLTRAAPKVADYPFTTLEPALGVLVGDDRQLVIADIPGLIEGASDGAGLGHDFLSHVERCRLLVHVLDLAPQLSQGEDADPVLNHETIERELSAYEPRLARLPRVLALSKADLLPQNEVSAAVEQWAQRLGETVPVIATSSATRQGLDELAATLMRMVPALEHGEPSSADGAPLPAAGSDLAEHMVYRPAERSGFSVRRLDDHVFAVHGRGIERLVQRFDAANEEAMAHLEGRLRRIGVIAALENAGFEPGDEIQIAGEVFELDSSPPR
ncbi:MAG TPA: GTPase ObgE [Solirubrobacteraceae bacterium]|nr:GTPase ObgE [Solirubrobacteraceae bacterium]